MPKYQNKNLVKIEEKSGGKNQDPVNGFYRVQVDSKQFNINSIDDKNFEIFFIKKPTKKTELFTELLAGLLLTEFINGKLVAEQDCSSLICADYIKFDDKSYGLIQPKVNFQPLFKIIGSGYHDQSDRAPYKEMLWGCDYYVKLVEDPEYSSSRLSIPLMYSLLLGAHSVHSGNIVRLEELKHSTSIDSANITNRHWQFARLDWGDAFRYFAHENNNKDILCFYQYQGFFNYKGLTQGYIYNYKKINNLFSAIAESAAELTRKLNKNNELLIESLVANAFAKIPVDLLDDNTQSILADYLCIPSFKNVTFGSSFKFGNNLIFVKDFSNVLERRLILMRLLQAPIPNRSEECMRQNDTIISLQKEQKLLSPELACDTDVTDDIEKILLQSMDDTELIRICCNKISMMDITMTTTIDVTDPDSLIGRIITDNMLWSRMRDVLEKISTDNPIASEYADINELLFKISRLYLWRKTYEDQFVQEKSNKSYEETKLDSVNRRDNQLELEDNKEEKETILDQLIDDVFGKKSLEQFIESMATLTEEQLSGWLKKTVRDDQRLSTALTVSSKKEPLPKKLYWDLMILKKFHNEKIESCTNHKFGVGYESSVHTFYEKALAIRLSNNSLQNQVQAIINTAHREFAHRHKTARSVADALITIMCMPIDVLCGMALSSGLTYQTGRGCMFFSNAPTARENYIQGAFKMTVKL